MLSNYLKKLIRQELEGMRADMAKYLAGLIVRNNEEIEENLIGLGLLERDAEGQLHVKPRSF